MGAIQGAINSMLNTAATAVSIKKHFGDLQQKAELANKHAVQMQQASMAQKLSFKNRMHVMEAYGKEGTDILGQMAGLKVPATPEQMGKPNKLESLKVSQAKLFMSKLGLENSEKGIQPFEYERALNIAGAHSGLGVEKFAKLLDKGDKK